MSAGKFTLAFYEADSAEIHVVKVQPETTAMKSDISGTNVSANGPATSPFWAKVSKNKRQYGLSPRSVSMRWTGGIPSGYADAVITLPVLTPAVFNGMTIGSTATYLGEQMQVIAKTPESLYPGI
jgi:hypothetical protein